MVVRCKTHKRSFTLYPPGYRPYGRRRLAPVALDGSALQTEPAGNVGCDEVASASARGFDGTVFAAALGAARGRAWPCSWQQPEPEARSAFWYSTQARHTREASRLLGLTSETGAEKRAVQAELLGVEVLVLHEQSGGLGASAGLVATGRAVAAVLAALPASGCLVDRLAEAGHVAGLWGEPWRWDPRHGVLRPRPFRPLGTRAPPCPT